MHTIISCHSTLNMSAVMCALNHHVYPCRRKEGASDLTACSPASRQHCGAGGLPSVRYLTNQSASQSGTTRSEQTSCPCKAPCDAPCDVPCKAPYRTPCTARMDAVTLNTCIPQLACRHMPAVGSTQHARLASQTYMPHARSDASIAHRLPHAFRT